MKYVVVTGGVVSGLGKGVTASSVGVLLKNCGFRVTSIKIGKSSLGPWYAMHEKNARSNARGLRQHFEGTAHEGRCPAAAKQMGARPDTSALW